MEKEYRVKIGNAIKNYPARTTYRDIAKEYQRQFEDDIVLVMIDGYRLRELNKCLEKDCEIRFLTTRDSIGHQTYKRSLCFLAIKSVYDVGGHDRVREVRIHFSYSKGYYCTIEGNVRLDEDFLKKVEQRMRKLVGEAAPIKKRSIPTSDAVELFRKLGMHDKERLFTYRRVSKVNVYSIYGFQDYFYGYMVPDTGYLKYFSLQLYNDGFIIQMPKKDSPKELADFAPFPKLFNVMKEAVLWGDSQGIKTVGALNDKIVKTDMNEVVLVQEAYQERKIGEIAKQIANKENVKFVLIAGPTSSGKTTFSHRLSIQLQVNGLMPHPIAVDNYFFNREKTPCDENGNYNYESIQAIDVMQFNEDMKALLAGKEVRLPIFNFKSGKREYDSAPTRLKKNDILVIEGIHCLNPEFTKYLEAKDKFKIYISALTQLNIDEHNRIPSADGRLIRRIVRDARTRGTSACGTIAMWESVRKGEEQNIFPYQEEADVMFNSSLLYELAVLKNYVEPLLFGIGTGCPEYPEAKRLLKFLDYFIGIGNESVPKNSILREFIGGGCFNL